MNVFARVWVHLPPPNSLTGLCYVTLVVQASLLASCHCFVSLISYFNRLKFGPKFARWLFWWGSPLDGPRVLRMMITSLQSRANSITFMEARPPLTRSRDISNCSHVAHNRFHCVCMYWLTHCNACNEWKGHDQKWCLCFLYINNSALATFRAPTDNSFDRARQI